MASRGGRTEHLSASISCPNRRIGSRPMPGKKQSQSISPQSEERRSAGSRGKRCISKRPKSARLISAVFPRSLNVWDGNVSPKIQMARDGGHNETQGARRTTAHLLNEPPTHARRESLQESASQCAVRRLFYRRIGGVRVVGHADRRRR